MGSKLADILKRNNKGWFETVHVETQSLGELDPFFVATFFEELGIHWEIFDGKGKQHNVEFNGSPTEPLLISGWGRLRLYYSWTGHQKLCLFYYGRNQFLMVESDNSDHVIPSFFPAFHSFSNFIGKYQTFFMTIGDQDVNSRRVIVDKEFGKFLTQSIHGKVKFSGPLANIVTVNLIIDYDNPLRVMFGEGWTSFCQLNQIVKGNRLSFKVNRDMTYSNILLVRIV
ncbi:hypothetical protein QL285_023057 [Trifolium repens]|nr:hypothetical protein QL285_023057 [Trifolium repens]